MSQIHAPVEYPEISAQRPTSLLGSLRNGVHRVVVALTIALMVCMVIDVAIQILYRYVLNDSLAWSDELGRYLFLWVVFMGGTMGVKENLHPSFGSVVHSLSPAGRSVFIMLGRVLTLGFCMDLLILSLKVMPTIATAVSPALQFPMSYLYLIFPIFSILSMFYTICHLWEDRRGIPAWGWLLGVVALGAVVCMSVLNAHLHLNFPATLVVLLLILFALGVPIAFVLGITSLGLLFMTNPIPLTIIPQRMFLISDNFSLMAIPFFMLTGALMQVGGVAERLVRLASVLIGWVRGGLGYADIFVSAFFADISGSAVADTAAIGSVMLPGMVKRGYDKPFATALQSAAGTLGVMIPPSITTILFAVTANVSVVTMFLASFIPALLVIVSFAVVVFFTAKKRDFPREPKPTRRELWEAFRGAFLPLWTPIIILGGILSGIFTPTEAGVVAVFYTLIVMAVTKQLNVKSFWHAMVDALHGTSKTMLIVASAFVLGWLLVVSQLSQTIANSLFSLSHNVFVILIIVNIFLALVHVVLESSSTILLIVPILMPILGSIGVDPIHFGILLLINSAIGLLTPPVGVILYIASGITNIRVETLARAVIPFILMLVVDLILVIIFPGIVSFLPNVLGH
ncbi:TRAP transporter large permease subunit [Aneurinibacillus sp. Ricciae_BoGa-3]|uniref:TRAP transporter large permease n=1 Tax=Aneurinibacillus sp. Ricciae_BoGa-3 TaxID=3022697 RepID=UPI0023420DAD|nr:TRAP transporter large permease subunit [Aneurinibacillus sp. Ricciae_BoGa-3]WCK53242.1 TRAP transporter large permease subunit [Aneurinibacillus sp. Ricciae_BoGa-3]